jgi:gliding motility-associated-like protein
LATIDDESCVYPEPIIVVPNVFTPNSDGANDEFVLDVTFYTNIELVILNRWGNTMYTSVGLNPSWSGLTSNVAEAGEGTYFYKYSVTSLNGIVYEGHGFLELVRD